MDIVSEIREHLNQAFPTMRINVIEKNPKLNSIDVVFAPSMTFTPQEVATSLVKQFKSKPLTNWDIFSEPKVNTVRLWFPRTIK